MKFSAICLVLSVILSQADDEEPHKVKHTFSIDPNQGTSTKTFQFDCKSCEDNPKIDVTIAPPIEVKNTNFVRRSDCKGYCVSDFSCDLDCYNILSAKGGHIDHSTEMKQTTSIQIIVNGVSDVHEIELTIQKLNGEDDDEDEDNTDITQIPP